MAELFVEIAAPILVVYRVGESVLIARGPLQGLAGQIAEIDGADVLIDLRDTVDGLLVRCPAGQLAAI